MLALAGVMPREIRLSAGRRIERTLRCVDPEQMLGSFNEQFTTIFNLDRSCTCSIEALTALRSGD
jgi:hypothetical protein